MARTAEAKDDAAGLQVGPFGGVLSREGWKGGEGLTPDVG